MPFEPSTPNLSLLYPDYAFPRWDVPLNYDIGALEGHAALAAGNVTIPAAERPGTATSVPTSTSLNVRVAPCSFFNSVGVLVTYAGTASVAMTTAATNYIYLTEAGTLTVNTTGFPATYHVRLAIVVAGATTITSIDNSVRVFLRAFGPDRFAVTATKTGAYTALASDTLVPCDASGGAFTVTLPTAVGYTGPGVVIKKIDASGNAVTVDGAGAETIDGAATYSLGSQWKYVHIRSNGTNWLIVANN